MGGEGEGEGRGRWLKLKLISCSLPRRKAVLANPQASRQLRGNSKSKHSLLPPTISCQELPWLDQFPEDEEGLALVQFREVSLPGHRAGGKDGKCWRQALSNPTRFILTQLTAARTGFSGPSFQRDTWFPEEVTLLPTQE